ncbi:alpha/beta hydrolase [Aggregicoccus sp. 17bor-14]|uniref:alpha/beta hydrolase n=1 Tax=Myxococcaceae TaxID=31 RepID=UPI00129C9E5C|nr:MULTISPECIES: alpha/beta hydrolase-fold protein [Myxococcaceae]MBF5045791.1 alpha/beta hydrolase [Simulacricoccus sp. 17bor-14]MRI91526.1 alpha/beta hydrolase [Aggregicoccus sp. 17bor-14]
MRVLGLCLLVLLGLVPAAHAAEAAPEVVPPHQTFTLTSKRLHEVRRLNVYTPPGYDAAKGARFPVLYMPDGGLQEDFPHVARDVDAAIRAGELRPMIVVGIENTERRRDMTGPTQVAEDRKIAPHVGGSAAFRAFVRDELIPEVRRRYRTTEARGIIGESLAGLFVLETFLQEPGLFDTWISLSPSLWWNDDALVRSAPQKLAGHRSLKGALYFATTGDDTMAPQATRLAEALRARGAKGLRWKYEPLPQLRHDNIYREASPRVLREWFPPEPKRAGAPAKGPAAPAGGAATPSH